MIRNHAPIRIMLAVLGFFLVLQIASGLFGKRYWLNLASSEPMGLYRMEKFTGVVKRGEMVIMSVTPQFRQYVYGRGWLPKGWLLFKHVGAVPVLFCFEDSSFTINGVRIGPVYPQDKKGLPLPRLTGCRRVPDRHFLPVAVRINNSFDGHYMGCVPIAEIRGLARPLLTF